MQKQNTIVLLGAGFSRNWGGWLASEVFEYLIGCPDITDSTRSLLWKYKNSGGYEGVLAALQENSVINSDSKSELLKFQTIIQQMFYNMSLAYQNVPFEFNQDYEFGIKKFLTNFDAIFSLNQDLLLEEHYLDRSVELMNTQRWNGVHIPAMRLKPGTSLRFDRPNFGQFFPDHNDFKIYSRLQPIFKLHGSCNWISSNDDQMLIMGGNKKSAIDMHPYLKWCYEQFVSQLSKEQSRLMVIGYSFSDEHINNAIIQAAENKNLSLFIIDPQGVDVLEKRERNKILSPTILEEKLSPYIIGASRRSLYEIFGRDLVEYKKIMRFF